MFSRFKTAIYSAVGVDAGDHSGDTALSPPNAKENTTPPAKTTKNDKNKVSIYICNSKKSFLKI